MTADAAPTRTGAARLVERAAGLWALAGGALLLAVVAVNTWSVLARALGGRPFAGAFEITEAGVAVAVFAFLPWCQITGANVSADIFTARASRRSVAAFTLLGTLAALGFALLLTRQMYLGLLDQKAFNSTTAILQLPLWWAFAAIVASLALLAVAALVTVLEAVRGLRAPA